MKNKKSLGQNWLNDRPTLNTIAELAADVLASTLDHPPRLCVEIGPGLGTLTSSLLRCFERVLAVEFDSSLAANLPKSFPGKNLTVVNQDILQFDFSQIQEPFVVAGNIPYYITTPIIEKLLTLPTKPQNIVLLVQKEVAQKAVGLPSNSSFSLFIDNFAQASLGPIVPRNLVTPPPKVDSCVLVLTPRQAPQASLDVLKFIHRSFTSPRKKLLTNLASFTGLPKTKLISSLNALGFSENARPADLSLVQYINLADLLKKS